MQYVLLLATRSITVFVMCHTLLHHPFLHLTERYEQITDFNYCGLMMENGVSRDLPKGNYLNQCWLLINRVQRESPEGSCTLKSWDINNCNVLENYTLKIETTSAKVQWNWKCWCVAMNPDATGRFLLIIPHEQQSCWGVYWFHSVRLSVSTSVRPSVRPSCLLCPLCNIYSSGWILSILATNDHYHERVCHTQWPLTLTYIFKVIRPWLRKLCPPCSVYSSGWILFICGTNDHYH